MAKVDDASQKIREDNDFFKHLIDMIPAQNYFDQDTKDEIRGEITVDEDSVQNAKSRKKKKHKEKRRGNADPIESKSVSQLQEDLDNKNTDQFAGTKLTEKKSKKSKKHGKVKCAEIHVRGAATSIDDLREKLHTRIAELKGKRGHLNPEEWLEKKKLQRKDSKLKLKMRRKKEKMNITKGDNSRTSLPNGVVTSPAKPVYNKEGKMVFSKFDFTDASEKTKTPMADLTGKNYRKILENLEKRKEKVRKLQETDVTAARELEKKTAWQVAIGKAEGVKIKDDPELLKKALKRKEKRKEKSTKAFENREQKTEQKMKDRQEKRQKNIDLRKQTKLKNKKKKAAKKGRIVPGF